MAVERETIALSFGIEDTVDTGQAEVLSALYDDPIVTVNPDEIQDIKKEDPKEDVTKIEKQIKGQKPTVSKEEEALDGEIDLSKTLEESLFQDDVTENEDEDDEKEETIDKEESKEENEKDEESEPIWASLSKDLTRLGIFNQEEDEEGNVTDFIPTTPEEFKDKFVDEIKRGVNNTVSNFLSRFGEDYKEAFEAIYVNGVHPKDYFLKRVDVENLKELDLTKEDNQELVVRRVLSEQGFEGQDIDDEIDRLKNYGDLEGVANRHHKVIVKKEEGKLKEIAEQKARELETQQRIEQEYQDSVFNLLNEKYKTKEFDGIPVNKKFAEETMDFLTTKKYKTPNGELLTEWDKMVSDMRRPENWGVKTKIAMLYQLLKTDPSLSTIKKRAVSEETNLIFNDVARHKTKAKRVNSPVTVKPKRSFID